MTRIFWLVLATVLGAVTGCGPFAPQPSEYGMPHARYRLSGRAVDHATGAAVRGIRIASPRLSTAVLSDSNGDWSLDTVEFPCDDRCSLTAADIDGAANDGLFDSLTVPIAPRRTSQGDGHWDKGSFEQDGIIFRLSRIVRR
jgi:putative lipoprotein (rSAM/lipoprotein system)